MTTATTTLTSPLPTDTTASAPTGLWQIAWRQLRRNRLAMVCLWILAAYTVVWVYAEGVFWNAHLRGVTPTYKISHYDIRNQPPSLAHLLGTNYAGRDNFGQVVQGTRIAYEIGLLTSLIVIPLGFVLAMALPAVLELLPGLVTLTMLTATFTVQVKLAEPA